jgi:hypothetical protein
MSSTMMVERTGTSYPGVPGYATPTPSVPTGMPAASGYLMVPRCTLKFEKCSGGMKVTCSAEDKTAASMMQNLCTMLAGGTCCCYCTWNGVTVQSCCFTMGQCKYEMTEKGICITCTSGDSKCCEMIQACCDCLTGLYESGCVCCWMINNTPVCCGYCHESGKPAKSNR